MCDFNVHGLFDNLNILSSAMSFLIRDSFFNKRGFSFLLPKFQVYNVGIDANLGVGVRWSPYLNSFLCDDFGFVRHDDFERSFKQVRDALCYSRLAKILRETPGAANFFGDSFGWCSEEETVAKMRDSFFLREFPMGFSYVSIRTQQHCKLHPSQAVATDSIEYYSSADSRSICDVFVDDGSLIVCYGGIINNIRSYRESYQLGEFKRQLLSDSRSGSAKPILSKPILSKFRSAQLLLQPIKCTSIPLSDPDYKEKLLDLVLDLYSSDERFESKPRSRS